MERKLREYFDAGTQLVWFVDLRSRTVTVYTSPDQITVLDESQTLDGGNFSPGCRFLFGNSSTAPVVAAAEGNEGLKFRATPARGAISKILPESVVRLSHLVHLHP